QAKVHPPRVMGVRGGGRSGAAAGEAPISVMGYGRKVARRESGMRPNVDGARRGGKVVADSARSIGKEKKSHAETRSRGESTSVSLRLCVRPICLTERDQGEGSCA